jgi:5-(carboxyamino)imidazole ribonucleotide synthase
VNVGVLGGGQLGRMLALAGHPLGFRFRFLEPHQPAPVDGLGEVIRAPYDDAGALRRFASGLDVVTYEFENVPDSTALLLEELLPVHPAAVALRTAQDRLAEKQAFEGLGIPTPVYHPVDSRPALE